MTSDLPDSSMKIASKQKRYNPNMEFKDDFDYRFDWDDDKANINLVKHKVSFDEGKTIFKDPF